MKERVVGSDVGIERGKEGGERRRGKKECRKNNINIK